MIRFANIIVFAITICLIGVITYDIYSAKPDLNNDELAILKGKFDKKGRLITKRKFDKIYNKVIIDTLEAIKLPEKIVDALNHQVNLLENSNTKKYKIGSLRIEKNQLVETSLQLKRMIQNKTIQNLKDSFQFFQLKGYDKKGNIRFTGYYVPEVIAKSSPSDQFNIPVFTMNSENKKDIIGYISSIAELKNIKLQGSGYLKFEEKRVLIGYSGKIKKETQVLADTLQTEDVDVDDDSIEASLRTEIEVDTNDESFVELEDKPSGAGIDPVVEVGDVVAAADLPEAGESGLHAQAAAVRVLVEALHLLDRQGPGSHEAHLAAQDVPELRQLVEAVAAEEATERGDARVVGDLEDGTLHLVAVGEAGLELLGIEAHRAELDHVERAAVEAGADLAVDRRAR